MVQNYSFYAIPAFYILSLVPTAVGNAAVAKARNGRVNNLSPRSTDTLEFIKKSVPKPVFQRFERAKAAHYNSLENFPLFTTAIICSNMAHLDPLKLNISCAAFLAVRTAYVFAYMEISNPKYSFVRSALWMVSVGICFYLLIQSGNVLAQ